MSVEDKNVKHENNYTKIPNSLIDCLFKSNFTATELEIILFVMRYTYGFGRDSHKISANFIANGINKSRRGVLYSLKELIDRNIILVIDCKAGQTSEIKVNSDCGTWLSSSETYCTSETHCTGAKQCSGPVQRTAPVVVQCIAHKKEKYINKKEEIKIKENKKEKSGNISKKNQMSEDVKNIVDYLNSKCGTNYRFSTKETKGHINARLNEGFTVDDFKTVIDKKAKEWKGTEWEKYLRPKTLFTCENFENYLNQPCAKGGRKEEVKHEEYYGAKLF